MEWFNHVRMVDMGCKQNQARMMDALDGTLARSEWRLFLEHLEICPRCRREWEALQAVESMFASPPMLHPAPGFVARVEARIERHEAQRRTLVGGLILLGAAVALCLLAVPALLNGRGPLEAYADFLGVVYGLLGSGLLLAYRLVSAVWLTLEAFSRGVDLPLTSLLTYLVGVVLGLAALRRAWTSQQVSVGARDGGRSR
jgi:predicted anti-sigma-YlaC factor YlaD